MAYTTKYILPFASPYNVGTVYLKKLDYVGSEITLRMRSDGLEIESIFDGWFSTILKQKAYITFVNTAADFFEYSDLFELEERDFEVVIEVEKDSGVITVFDGWLNSETIQQKYLHNSDVRLTATNYVSKLEYHYDDDINTLDERSFIDFVTQALIGTGKEDDLALNCHLFPVGYEANSSTHSGLVKAGVFTEVFWENNIERMSSLEVLETILLTFDCYLYWWDGQWWVERYREIYQASINYYPYEINPSTSYDYNSAVTQQSRVNEIRDITDFDLTDTNQTLSTIPGYNKLEIFLNQKYFLNLVFNDFTNAEEFASGGFAPALREWEYFEGNVYSLVGKPYSNIGNSIKRFGWDTDSSEIGTPEFFEYQYGIGTKFRMTVSEITNLTLQWKSTFNCGALGAPACSDPSSQILTYYYWIRIVGTNKYLYYDANNLDSDAEKAEWIILQTDSEKEACNTIVISGAAAFKDNIYKAFPKVSIPLTDIDTMISDSGITVTSLSGDYDFELMIGLCIGDHGGSTAPPLGEFLGDIVATADNESQDNLITGQLDNNVLKDERIEIDLFDSNNWNYVNALLTDTLYDKRTATWVEDEDSASPDYPLSKWSLISKFQLFNRNRKRFNTTIVTSEIFRPFDLFIDGNDSDRKYILGTHRWKVMQGEYDAQFEEYDNTDDINLI